MLTHSTWFLLALAALFATGLVTLFRSVSKIASDLEFIYEYREKFHVFAAQGDSQAYAWLTLNANRMQAQMGTQGLMTFKPPFANHMIHNYPVVINILPEVRKCLTDHLLSQSLLSEYASLLDEALMRYQGSLLEHHRTAVVSAKNPVFWLTSESPRILRRLHTLRRWSHEQEIKPFFTRGARTRCPHGARTPRRVPLPVGHH